MGFSERRDAILIRTEQICVCGRKAVLGWLVKRVLRPAHKVWWRREVGERGPMNLTLLPPE